MFIGLLCHSLTLYDQANNCLIHFYKRERGGCFNFRITGPIVDLLKLLLKQEKATDSSYTRRPINNSEVSEEEGVTMIL